MRISIPDEIKFDLERRMRGHSYMGVDLGLVLKSFFGVTIDVSFRAALAAFLHSAFWVLFGARHKQFVPEVFKNRIWFTLTAKHSRLTQLVMPIIRNVGAAECNVLSGVAGVGDVLPENCECCNVFHSLPGRTLPARLMALRDMPALLRIFMQWSKDNNVSCLLLPQFVFYMICQYVYIRGLTQFVDVVRPKCVVADYEHYHLWAILIQLANNRGIPTMSVMHGEIYSAYGWTPLISSRLAVWGESQKRQLVEYGVDPKRIDVCGCPRVDTRIRVDVQAVRKRLGLDVEKPIALLATNPIAIEQRLKLVQVFADSLRDEDGIIGLVRLHPSEDLGVYTCLQERCPWIKIRVAKGWTLEESVAISRVIVNHDSSFGGDALLYGRPVIELDVLPGGLTNGRKLVERAGCPLAKDAEGLRMAIVDLCMNEDLYRHHLELAEPFVRDLFFAVGDEAGRNTAKVLREVAAVNRAGS